MKRPRGRRGRAPAHQQRRQRPDAPVGYSRQDLFHHLSVYIGQAKIASGVAVSELLVVKPQKVENRRVQIMHVDDVLDRAKAKFIRRAMHMARPSHRRRPATWKSRKDYDRGPCLALPESSSSTVGVRPNSPPQITSVSSNMPRCFRSLSNAPSG